MNRSIAFDLSLTRILLTDFGRERAPTNASDDFIRTNSHMPLGLTLPL
jgi:hypothetical protein